MSVFLYVCLYFYTCNLYIYIFVCVCAFVFLLLQEWTNARKTSIIVKSLKFRCNKNCDLNLGILQPQKAVMGTSWSQVVSEDRVNRQVRCQTAAGHAPIGRQAGGLSNKQSEVEFGWIILEVEFRVGWIQGRHLYLSSKRRFCDHMR